MVIKISENVSAPTRTTSPILMSAIRRFSPVMSSTVESAEKHSRGAGLGSAFLSPVLPLADPVTGFAEEPVVDESGVGSSETGPPVLVDGFGGDWLLPCTLVAEPLS